MMVVEHQEIGEVMIFLGIPNAHPKVNKKLVEDHSFDI